MLVLSLDLQDVEEVGRRGVNLDQVLIRLWRRVRKGDNLEVINSLGEVISI